MAINALAGLASQWYEPEKEELTKDNRLIPKVFEEGEEPDVLTGFKIRPLSSSEYLDVLANPGVPGIKKAFFMCVEDWRHFVNGEGVEIPFSIENAQKYVPAMFMYQIGKKIIDVSDFTGEKAKN